MGLTRSTPVARLAFAVLLGAALPAAAGPATPATPEVRLLEPGAEPRGVLRYAFGVPVGRRVDVQLYTSSRTTAGSLELPVITLPPLTLQFVFQSEAVRTDGSVRIGFRLEAANAPPAGDLPPAAVESLQGELVELKGLSGHLVVDPRGFTREAGWQPPPGGGPKMLRDVVEGLHLELRQLAIPLPKQAVGPGARWEVTSDIVWEWMRLGDEVHAFHGQQTTEYRLTDRGDGRIEVQLKRKQVFPTQELMPKNELGSPGRLDILSSETVGRATVWLSTPLPELELSTKTTKRSRAVTAPGRPARESASDTTTKLVLRPK